MGAYENLLSEINDFGLYQKLRYLLICIAALLPPIVTYIHSFTAANVKHRCKNPFDQNDSFETFLTNLTLAKFNLSALNKCEFILIDGTAKKCDEWVYDHEYYKSTLTEQWEMVCDKSSWRSSVQMVYFAGYLIGSIVMGVLADIFGRRPIMLSAFIMLIAGSAGAAFGPQDAFGPLSSYFIYAVSRFLIACGTRGINVTGFVLGMEMMGPGKRTFAGIVIEYFFAIGQLILVFIAYFVRDWRTLSWIVIILTLPFLSYFFLLPESPRWLLSKNKNDKAFSVLNTVAKTNKRVLSQDSWEKLIQEEKYSSGKKEQENLMDVFKSRKLCIICSILFLNWIINNFIFYGVGLKSNDLGVSPYLSFAISAGVEILAYVLTHMILDLLGRKLPYCTFLLFAGISLLSIVFVENVNVVLIFAMIGKFCASASYAIIYLYSSELFPTSIRNSCMGSCSMMARIGAITAPFIIGLADSLSSPSLPFLVFGVSGILGSLTALILPETLNRELPQKIHDADLISKFGLSFKYVPEELPYENTENIKLNEKQYD